MKKRIDAFALTLIIAFSSLCSAFAAQGATDHFLSGLSEKRAAIAEDVRQAVSQYLPSYQSGEASELGADRFQLNRIYQEYMTDQWILLKADETGTLSYLMDEKSYRWALPVTGKLPVAERENEEMYGTAYLEGDPLLGTALTVGGYYLGYARTLDMDDVIDIIEASELIRSEVTDIRIFSSSLYTHKFAYVTTNDGSFVISMSSGSWDEAGIKEGEVYTEQDFLKKMNAYFDEAATKARNEEAEKLGEQLYGGGVLTKPQSAPANTYLWWVIGTNVLVIAVIAAFLGLRKKKAAEAAAE